MNLLRASIIGCAVWTVCLGVTATTQAAPRESSPSAKRQHQRGPASQRHAPIKSCCAMPKRHHQTVFPFANKQSAPVKSRTVANAKPVSSASAIRNTAQARTANGQGNKRIGLSSRQHLSARYMDVIDRPTHVPGSNTPSASRHEPNWTLDNVTMPLVEWIERPVKGPRPGGLDAVNATVRALAGVIPLGASAVWAEAEYELRHLHGWLSGGH